MTVKVYVVLFCVGLALSSTLRKGILKILKGRDSKFESGRFFIVIMGSYGNRSQMIQNQV